MNKKILSKTTKRRNGLKKKILSKSTKRTKGLKKKILSKTNEKKKMDFAYHAIFRKQWQGPVMGAD